MRFSSYWLDTSEPFVGNSPDLDGGRCDVVVVGGGITGSAAALALAKKGARVVLCEAGTVGQAASGRNGGMCNNGFAQDYASLSQRIGTELANRLYLAFDAGVDTVERLVREEAIDCDFVRRGKLKLAAKPEHFDKLARSHALLAASVDPDTRLLTKAELRDEIGSDRHHGGMILRQQMISVFPELADVRIDYCWGGMVDMTANRLPRAGERDGVYYSMGYSGHGTHMATLMGTLMAEIMDGRADLNPWKDFDWPAIPGHFGKPWFLPFVGAWYRLKDILQ